MHAIEYILYFVWYFIEFCSQGSKWQQPSIGPGNALEPKMQQAIIRTNLFDLTVLIYGNLLSELRGDPQHSLATDFQPTKLSGMICHWQCSLWQILLAPFRFVCIYHSEKKPFCMCSLWCLHKMVNSLQTTISSNGWELKKRQAIMSSIDPMSWRHMASLDSHELIGTTERFTDLVK